jgi:hypothetical protein
MSSYQFAPLSPSPPASNVQSPLSDLQVQNLRLFEFRLESTSAAVEDLRRQGRDLEDKHADLVTNRSRLDEERNRVNGRGLELQGMVKAKLGTDEDRRGWRKEYDALGLRMGEIEKELEKVLAAGRSTHGEVGIVRERFIAAVKRRLAENAQRAQSQPAHTPIQFGPILLDSSATKRPHLSPLPDSPPTSQPPAKVQKVQKVRPSAEVAMLVRLEPPCERCGKKKNCMREMGATGPCVSCKKDRKQCSANECEFRALV